MFENIIAHVVIGIFGVLFLILSAEFVVHKLIRIARHYGVSNTFVGLTIMSIGTSLPEIASHVIASVGILSGRLDYEIASSTVLGANIGSDVIQQTFVLGVVILLAGGFTFSKSFLKRSYSIMIATTLLTLILGFDQSISRLDGAILFGVFIWYMFFLYSHETKMKAKKVDKISSVHFEIFLTFLGMAVLLFSSSIVLESSEFIVTTTGIGGSLIGVVTLGIASALPEMLTAIVGMRKGAHGISLGTLIGSNITNPLLAIGLGGLISTYFVPKPLIFWDLPMETISAALLLIWLLFNKRKLGKGGALYLIGLYFAYLFIRVVYFSTDGWT